MANKKLNQLPLTATVDPTDLIYIVKSNTSYGIQASGFIRDTISDYSILTGLSQYIISGSLSERLGATGALIITASGGLSQRIESTGTAIINQIYPSNTATLYSGDKLRVLSGNNTSYSLTIKNFDNGLHAFPSSGKIISIDSMKALRAINITGIDNNSKVHVKSYYDDSETFVTLFLPKGSRDEGGGHFYWNTGAYGVDDSGQFIRPNCVGPGTMGRWVRTLDGGIPNVHMWGAKGDAYQETDGTSGYYLVGSDDTAPIQNALNASRFGYGGVLRFPARTYKVTDTLYWYTQQTALVGDGCVNSTNVLMKENINKDIIRSVSWSGVLEWNANPSLPSITAGSFAADVPKMRDMLVGYAGNSYLNDVAGFYGGRNTINTGNSVLTLAAVGEANLIEGCYFLGGKYAIRVIAGSPGLRAYGCTIAGMGEAGISVEGFPSQTFNGISWVPNLNGGGGMLSLIDCSADYNGLNTGVNGFAYVKNHNDSYANIYIKNQKFEGPMPGGMVTYIVGSGINGRQSHVDIDGLAWNATTHTLTVDSSVVVISGKDPQAAYTVNTSLKNLMIQGVPNLIKDYILVGNTGDPYILKSDNWLGYPNYTQATPEINHYGQNFRFTDYRGKPTWTYSTIADTRTKSTQVKFRPMKVGWYRIAIGEGSSWTLFNHDFTIRWQNGTCRLSALADYNLSFGIGGGNACQLKSKVATYFPQNAPMTRARLFHDEANAAGDTNNRVCLDIYFDTLPNSGAGYENYETLKYVTIDSETEPIFGRDVLITPVYLDSTLNIPSATSQTLKPYAEVDLTRSQDMSQSRANIPKDALLIDKDFYLFTTENRELRAFDAGVKVVVAGGGGASAAVSPIVVNGAIVDLIITNSGAGYTSNPTLTAVPNSPGNGSSAVLSGVAYGGFLSGAWVINGGSNYCVGPNSATDGYPLSGTGFSTTVGGGSTILNGVTGYGRNFFIPRFTPDRSGLMDSNIVDSGTLVKFHTTNGGAQSTVMELNTDARVIIGTGVAPSSKTTIYGNADETSLSVYGAPIQNSPIQVWYSSGQPTADVDNHMLSVNRRLGFPIKIGGLPGLENAYAGLWVSTATPSATNYLFLGDVMGNSIFNASTAIHFRSSNTVKMSIGSAGVGIGLDNGENNYLPTHPFQVSGVGWSFVVRSNNRVGIGNEAPIAALDVSGHIYASGGKVLTSVDSGNIVAQISAGITTVSGLTGVGTQFFVPRFTANGSGVYNSNIIDSGTSMVFHTTNGGSQKKVLELDTNARAIIGTGSTATAKATIYGNTDEVQLAVYGAPTQTSAIQQWYSSGQLTADMDNHMFAVNRRLGFPIKMGGLPGFENAYAGLWVSNDTPTPYNYSFLSDAIGNSIFNGASGVHFRIVNDTKMSIGANGVGIGLNNGANNYLPTHPFQVSGTNWSFMVGSNRRVGIGTEAPIAALDVSGHIYASGGKVLTAADSGNLVASLGGGSLSGVAGVSGVSVTGGVAITGALNLFAGSNISLTQAGRNNVTISLSAAGLYIGSGSPEGIVSAVSGSIYTDWANITLYQKITGVGAYGWY